jgi:pimeloyl-ACP methyl ester carboxylesterase
MLLATRDWGTGGKVAVLLHGMLGSAHQFRQVGPALAARGYHAIAVDLPGHGRCPTAPDATLDLFAESVIETVGTTPALAIGHSLGAVVLAAALPVLRPAAAVYVDVPFSPGQPPAADLITKFTAAKARRTLEQLRYRKPDWSEEDRLVEAEAARQFDPATAAALEGGYLPSGPPNTSTPSLLIRADPSDYVSTGRAAELQQLGFRVVSIRGAGHAVWYTHLAEFLAVVQDSSLMKVARGTYS